MSLDAATLITTGPGAGQFFRADGIMNQITVEDTRDGGLGWTVSGMMGPFTSGSGRNFSGSELGWTPILTKMAAYTDSDGATYTLNASEGPPVAPNRGTSSGLTSGSVLGYSTGTTATTGSITTGPLGVAQLDADIHVLIPIFVQSDTYSGVLTITII